MPLALRTDLLAPRYLIQVEGTRLREDVTQFIGAVTYEEGEGVAAKIELSVNNHGFRFLESRVFAEGNQVDLFMGYVGKPLHFMNRGFIVKPNTNFPRSGIPKMMIVAHDASRRLMTSDDKGRTYKKKRDSQIAESIFGEAKIAPFVFETKGLRTRTRKRGDSKWEFLTRLARLHGFEVFVEYDPRQKLLVGFFGPPEQRDQGDRHTFIYGTGEPDATLLEFSTDVSIAQQETKVEVVYTTGRGKTRKTHKVTAEVKSKSAEKTKFTGDVATRPLKKSIPNGPTVTLTVFGQQTKVIADRSFATPAQAKRFAAAWFRRRQQDFAFGRGVIVGSPDVRRGQIHELRGLGNRLSGDWQLTSVRHRMASGQIYETEFTGRKVALESVVGAPGNVSGVKNQEVAA